MTVTGIVVVAAVLVLVAAMVVDWYSNDDPICRAVVNSGAS